MRLHLTRIIVVAITAACEPDHRFAFTELTKVASALIEFSVAEDCSVQLFEDSENAPGLAAALLSELSNTFPCVASTDLEALCEMMIEEPQYETFEQTIIQLVSKAKVETEEEIIRHIRVLRVKAAIGMGLLD